MDTRDSEPEELNLEQAEFAEEASGPPSCAVCGNELFGTYFEINGLGTCEGCRFKVEEESKAGSSSGRFFRALIAGIVAGIVGALIWYAVQELTGYHVGLVAIVVGWLVGKGVRWGCNARGGWVYQGMAITLTYLAIVVTFIPDIFTEIRDMDLSEFEEEVEISAPIQGDGSPVASEDEVETTAIEGEVENTEAVAQPQLPVEPISDTARALDDDATVAGPEAEDLPELHPAVKVILGGILLMVFAMIAPFLSGSIIGLIIIAIGLYEAWRQNKKLVLNIEGPFQIGERPAGGVVEEEEPPAITP